MTRSRLRTGLTRTRSPRFTPDLLLRGSARCTMNRLILVGTNNARPNTTISKVSWRDSPSFDVESNGQQAVAGSVKAKKEDAPIKTEQTTKEEDDVSLPSIRGFHVSRLFAAAFYIQCLYKIHPSRMSQSRKMRYKRSKLRRSACRRMLRPNRSLNPKERHISR